MPDFVDPVLDDLTLRLADRFQDSGMFDGMTRKEVEAMAMGYVTGARHTLQALGLDFDSLQVIPDGGWQA